MATIGIESAGFAGAAPRGGPIRAGFEALGRWIAARAEVRPDAGLSERLKRDAGLDALREPAVDLIEDWRDSLAVEFRRR